MKCDEHNVVHLAITEVTTKTVGTSVEVALYSREMSSHHRRRLCSPQTKTKTSSPRLLSRPCHVDLSLKLEKFNCPTKRNETWIYIEDIPQVTGVVHILRHLQPVQVVLGQSFQLSCLIESSTQPQMVWYRNGTELAIDGKRRVMESVDGKVLLKIIKSQMEDGGQYEVRFTNTFGAKESSKTDVVILAEHPRFLLPVVTSYAVDIGDEVTLSYRVVGIPTPEVTWLTRTTENGNSDMSVARVFVQNRVDVIDGVDTVMTSLKIDRAGVQHSKMKWVCRASNLIGCEERCAEIVTRGPVKIAEPLGSLHIHRGRIAKLRFKAVGWPRPEVIWRFAGQPLNVTSFSKMVGTLEGGQEVVESLLEIDGVTAANEGIYTVTAFNKWNSESSQAKLTVPLEAPEFTERFHDKTVEEGAKLHLSAAVTGVPLPSIQWYRNDVLLMDSNTCVIQNNGEKCSLTIKAISKEESGRYKCVAENKRGLAKCMARIQVTVRDDNQPMIRRRQTDVDINEDNKCVFEVTTVGRPQLEVVRFQDRHKVSDLLNTKSDRTSSNCSSLIIDNVKQEHSGSYTLRTSNIAGETSSSTHLSVTESSEAVCTLSHEESLNAASKHLQFQPFQPNVKVKKPSAHDADLTFSASGQGRLSANERSNERQLTFIRTTRMGPGSRLSTVVGEIEYRAEMTVEDCETQVVEAPILNGTDADHNCHYYRGGLVVAEFLCQHDDFHTTTVTTPSHGEPRPAAVQEAPSFVERKPRPWRWNVSKAYVYKGDVTSRVEQWSVRSYVECVEAMIDVSRNVLDNVKFAEQNVEFRIVLSSPSQTSTWFKDGQQVAFVDVTAARSQRRSRALLLKPKYAPNINESGLVHTLVVNNVDCEDDEGVYAVAINSTPADDE